MGAKKAIKLLKSYGYSDKELDLSNFLTGESAITILRPFGEKLMDVMANEEEDTCEETFENIEASKSDSEGNKKIVIGF